MQRIIFVTIIGLFLSGCYGFLFDATGDKEGGNIEGCVGAKDESELCKEWIKSRQDSQE